MRKSVVIAVVAVVLLVGAGIGMLAAGMIQPGSTPPPLAVASPSVAPVATPSPTPPPTPPPTPTPTPTPVRLQAALTGRLVTENNAYRHPIAVMIDDHAGARPQSGLNAASVVWHAPAEGGIPRYMAIFQDRLPEDLGPVRSARSYYIAWAAEWRAVYVHAGGSPQALATLAARGRGQYVYNADEFRYSTYFRRVSDRFPPHNLYTNLTLRHRLRSRIPHGRKPAVSQITP